MATTKKIEALRMDNGQLPAFAWPGGYPLYYVAADGDVFCPDCASPIDAGDVPIVDYDANWEDPELFCAGCGGRIESAYAEED